MSNKILQKRNITNTNKPTHIESDVGELVVNTLTGRVYTQKSDGTTVELKDFNDRWRGNWLLPNTMNSVSATLKDTQKEGTSGQYEGRSVVASSGYVFVGTSDDGSTGGSTIRSYSVDSDTGVYTLQQTYTISSTVDIVDLQISNNRLVARIGTSALYIFTWDDDGSLNLNNSTAIASDTDADVYGFYLLDDYIYVAKERYLKVYSLGYTPSQVASYDIGSGSSPDWLTGGIWSNGEFVIGLSGTEGAFVWSFDGSTLTYKSNYDVGSDDFTAITGDKNVIYIQDAAAVHSFTINSSGTLTEVTDKVHSSGSASNNNTSLYSDGHYLYSGHVAYLRGYASDSGLYEWLWYNTSITNVYQMSRHGHFLHVACDEGVKSFEITPREYGYYKGDLVYYSGSTYISDIDDNTSTPGNVGGFWTKLASKGDKGQKGDLGPQGNQGPQGNIGNQGPQGNIGNQGPKGEKGQLGDKGQKGVVGKGNTITWVEDGTSGNMVISDDNLTISNGTQANNTWDYGIVSQGGITGGFSLSHTMNENDGSHRCLFGVSTDPTDSNSYDLDYTWYFHLDGTYDIYEGGSDPTPTSSYGSFAVDTKFEITYDNDKIRYYYNGSLVRTTDVAADLTFYVDSSFTGGDDNTEVANIHFIPMGAVGNKGQKGDSGDKGQKGDLGPQGNIGNVGPKGQKGDLGPQGNQGPQGNIGNQGPQGNIGNQGPKGEKGQIGITGDGNTIQWDPNSEIIFSDDNRSITLDSSGTDGWQSSYDLNEYKHGAAFYFNFGSSSVFVTNKYVGIGFTDYNPANNLSTSEIDYGFDWSGAWVSINEGGSSVVSFTNPSVDDEYCCIYDNDKIYYYRNGVLARTTDVNADLQFTFTALAYHGTGTFSLEDVTVFSNIAHIPVGKSGKVGKGNNVIWQVNGTNGTTTISDDNLRLGNGTHAGSGSNLAAWDFSYSSERPITSGCSLVCDNLSSSNAYIVGLDTNPPRYFELEYSFVVWHDGTLYLYENNSNVASAQTTWSAGDNLQITYDNDKISYYRNGTLLRSVDVAADLIFYAEAAFRQDRDNAITGDIHFLPMGSVGDKGQKGSDGSAIAMAIALG